MNLTLQTKDKILQTKSILNQVSDISYRYDTARKQAYMNNLSEEEGREVLSVFESIVNDLRGIVERSNYGNERT